MLDKMNFSKIFNKAYCSAHLGCKKPNQDFYQKIFDDLENIKKEEILFWDDKHENVEAAKNFLVFKLNFILLLKILKKKMKQYIL